MKSSPMKEANDKLAAKLLPGNLVHPDILWNVGQDYKIGKINKMRFSSVKNHQSPSRALCDSLDRKNQ